MTWAGDIEPEGGTTIHTPNINRMAAEGNVLTDYYATEYLYAIARAC
jgi:arylsulfatase A-like enzyme